MVFLPDEPHDPFRNNLSEWGSWRDDGPIGLAPHTITTFSGKLSETINQLIQAFADNRAPFMIKDLSKLVETYTVTGLAHIILQGIMDAGVYKTLGWADFNYQELHEAAACLIDHRSGSGKTGVYVRFQKSTADTVYWKRDTMYAYVGKAEEDFYERYKSHEHGSDKYAILNQNSTDLVSFALCVLENQESGVHCLAQQILLCLLGTYTSAIKLLVSDGHKNADETVQSLPDVAAASYCIKMSNDVFRSTGWNVATSRTSFGILDGANTLSPLDKLEIMDKEIGGNNVEEKEVIKNNTE